MRLAAACLRLLAAAWILAASLNTARAQVPDIAPQPAAEEKVQYRRYYIPDDQKAELTRGYVPVRRQQLEQWLDEADRSQGRAPPRVQLTSAHYIGRYEDGELRDGFALFDFQNTTQQAVAAILDPLNIALGDGVWLKDERTPASVGTGADGQHRVLVPESGRLLIPWSMRGSVGKEGDISFDLQLPSSPLNRFIVALPVGSVPMADGALISPWNDQDSSWREYPEAAAIIRALQEGYVLWCIEFAGPGNIPLTIVASADSPADRGLITSQQTSDYTLVPSRLELQAEISLTVHRLAIHGLLIHTDEGLKLTDARLGEQPIDWTIETRSGAGESYRLQFPQPTIGSNLTLRLTLHADLVANEPWALPRVRMPDVFWQEERVNLKLAETLVLTRLQTEDCTQTRHSRLPRAGESYEFQCSTPAYQLQLNVQNRKPELNATAGVVVRMDREVITARWIADVRATWGEQFQLTANVAKPWTVTQVELEPATSLDTAAGSWRLENGKLEIPLREPITVDRPVRVMVEARRRTPPERLGLPGAQLQFLRFLDMPAPQVTYRLQGATQQQIKLVNDLRVERVDPQSLSAEDLQRLGGATDDMILRGNSLRSATAFLVQDVPGYMAESHVQVNVGPDAITESYVIRCTPESLPIRQVRVRLSQGRTAPLEWHLNADRELLAARLVPDAERSDGMQEGELWEIDLPSQHSSQFELRAQRKVIANEPVVIALASVPQAASESGELIVRSYEPVHWENGGLEPLPLPLPSVTDMPQRNLRGVFRYQPSQMDKFTVQRVRSPAVARAWVWLARYTTRVFADGECIHEALFRLQNTGRDRVDIAVPREITVLNVDVDGRVVPHSGLSRSQITVPLLVDQGFPTIRIRYVTQGEPLTWRGQIQTPLPRPDLTVLKSEWMLLFPSDYRVWNDSWSERGMDQLPSSVAERLLGPFMRNSAEVSSYETSRGNRDTINSFLHRFGEIATSSTAKWTDVAELDRNVAGPTGERWRVLVDERALASRGIGPEVSLPTSREADVLEKALAVLHLSDAAVVVGQQTFLITTGRAIRAWSDALVPSLHAGVFRTKQHSWLDRLLVESSHGALAGLVPIGTWKRSPSRLFSWEPESPFAPSDYIDAGWSAARMELPSSDLPAYVALPLLRTTSVQQWAWSAYLAVVACGCWWCARRKRRLVFIDCVALAVALLTPPALLPIGTAVFLGAVTATLILTIVPPPRRAPLPAVPSHVALGSTTLGGVLLVAWFASAQEPPPAPAASSVHAAEELRILIPTDASGAPTGEYWYVSQRLHQLLSQRFESVVEGGSWMLGSAKYILFDNTAQVPELTVQIKLETFTANQIVELPFQRDQVQLIDARLDNRPAKIRWNATNTAILVEVTDPDEHDLELSLGARRTVNGEVDFAIPPVTTATLIVRGTAELETPTALGASKQVGNQRHVALGPTARLLIRDAAAPAARMQAARVEQRLWYHIRPNSVVLDAVWTFDVAQGRLDKFTVLADPRLRLLPLANGQPVDGEPTIEQVDYQRIEFRLKPSAGSRFSLHASFYVRDASGVGRQRLPRVEVLDVLNQRRQFAISRANTIELSDVLVSDAEEISVEAFLEGWSTATEIPEIAFECAPDTPISDKQWTATSRFLPATTTADHQVTLRAGAEHVEIQLNALLATVGGPVFQRRLAIPRNFEPSSVTILSGETTEAARYAISADGELTVFFPASSGAQQRLIVRGTIPVADGELMRFVLPRVLDAKITSLRLEAFRLAEIAKLELEQMDGWALQDQVPPQSIQISDPVRFVGAWTITNPGAENGQVTLRITPNQVRSRGYLATRLSRDVGGWTAEAEYHLEVDEGVVDVVRLELPTEWEGPFECDPAYPFELRPLPGNARRQLVIRPPRAVDKEFTVRVRGSLAGSGERVRRAPDIMPLDVTQWQRFLVVPTRLETQQIVWSTSGLVERALPAMFDMAEQSSDAWETYQILESQFHAALQRIERVAGLPQVRLADVYVYWGGNGQYAGLAAFDVEPAGLTEVVIAAPRGVEVQTIFVDGNPTPVRRRTDHYHVTLGPLQLPQRVEVVFTGRNHDGTANDAQFIAPWPVHLPVARTMWNIASPGRTAETWSLVDRPTPPAEINLTRLESAAAIIDASFELAAESGVAQAQHWLGRWSSRVIDTRLRYNQIVGNDGRTNPALARRLTVLEELWRGETTRLGSAIVQSMLSGESTVQSDDLTGPWRAAIGCGSTLTSLMLPGSAPRLRWSAVEDSAELPIRIGLAALALVVGFMSLVWVKRTWVPEWVKQYPQALFALAGILWIALLQPPAVGWCLLAVAVASSIFSPFRASRLRV